MSAYCFSNVFTGESNPIYIYVQLVTKWKCTLLFILLSVCIDFFFCFVFFLFLFFCCFCFFMYLFTEVIYVV